ncbi:MAG: hypothetical protein EBU85_06330 [Actinobacteria bacterium]|nr:hypothetical protein [Actinomycetota bacterium]
MGLLSWRSPKLPAAVRAAMQIARSERVLAAAVLARGRGHVALTTTGLHVALSGDAPLNVAWDHVAHASWEDPMLVAVVDVDGQQLRISLELNEPGMVPVVLRERVTSTVVWECHRVLADGLGARFIARRAVGAGPVRWAVVFDDGVAADNPALRAAADAVLAELRADLGL